MGEYIKRAELIADLKRFAPEHYAELIDQIIRNQPAEDVVPVVRCEECKLHGHCVVEDVFNIARMPDSKMFCAVGKRVKSDTADRCVSCGEIIPEGRQVCPACEGVV